MNHVFSMPKISSPCFDAFRLRHGESATQALIENWERHFHQKPVGDMSLRQRWGRMMAAPFDAKWAA